MSRRGLSLTLLALFAVHLLGTMAFASVCLEPCPDDAESTTCPPVCALCTSCTHAQTGIVLHSAIGTPLLKAHRFVPQQAVTTSQHLAADIFHVPLFG